MTRRAFAFWMLLSLGILLLDQASKQLISQLLEPCNRGCESIVLLPVFQLVLVHNEGAAFSLLSDAGGWQRWLFAAVSSAVSLFLVIWLRRLGPSQQQLALALALVLGGALGNLLDRLLLGYVVDFLLVHYGNWYFPAFNFADASISVGVLLMLLDVFSPEEPQDGHA